MKAIIHALAGMTLVLCMGTAAGAQTEPTGEMLTACRPWLTAKLIADDRVIQPIGDPYALGQCWGAFSAIQYLISVRTGGKALLSVCAPAESTRVQVIAIFVKLAENNPKRWHESFMGVAIEALREAYPCRTTPAPARTQPASRQISEAHPIPSL